jgi:hypothetical protein
MHVYKCLPIIGTQSAYIIAVKRDERGNKMAILSKLDAEVIRYHREVEDARDDIKRNQPTEAKTMAIYSIKTSQKSNEEYKTMIIIDNAGNLLAEYRLDAGEERKQIARLRRSINNHLADGGTLGNYQW